MTRLQKRIIHTEDMWYCNVSDTESHK